MADIWSNIKAWRARADEIRAVADQFIVPSAKDSLRRLAANYDKLADDAEMRLAACAPPGEDAGEGHNSY